MIDGAVQCRTGICRGYYSQLLRHLDLFYNEPVRNQQLEGNTRDIARPFLPDPSTQLNRLYLHLGEQHAFTGNTFSLDQNLDVIELASFVLNTQAHDNVGYLTGQYTQLGIVGNRNTLEIHNTANRCSYGGGGESNHWIIHNAGHAQSSLGGRNNTYSIFDQGRSGFSWGFNGEGHSIQVDLSARIQGTGRVEFSDQTKNCFMQVDLGQQVVGDVLQLQASGLRSGNNNTVTVTNANQDDQIWVDDDASVFRDRQGHYVVHDPNSGDTVYVPDSIDILLKRRSDIPRRISSLVPGRSPKTSFPI